MRLYERESYWTLVLVKGNSDSALRGRLGNTPAPEERARASAIREIGIAQWFAMLSRHRKYGVRDADATPQVAGLVEVQPRTRVEPNFEQRFAPDERGGKGGLLPSLRSDVHRHGL